MKPQNFEEQVVWYYIIGTYVLYFAGIQFLVAPAVAWLLGVYVLWKLWRQNDQTPPEERISIPLGAWIWIGGMTIVGVALIMGHLDWNYGLTRIIKSFINFFMRTWALMALFPLAGCLKIRPRLVFRAICILGIQTLVFVPIGQLLAQIGIDTPIYANRLAAKIGGNSVRYYNVSMFVIEDGKPRLSLFAPWPPALAFACCVHFYIACRESSWKWKLPALIGTAAAVWGSASRLGQVCMFSLPVISLVLGNLSRPAMQMMMGTAGVLGGLFGAQLLQMARDFKENFEGQRASSSHVRAALGRLALYRWENDAPIWGHAFLAPKGPEVVAFMPVGSHHTWFGVLFAHGIVGFIGLIIPVIYTFMELVVKAQHSAIAKTALSTFLVIIMFSFGENLETLAYIYWPGLLVLGLAFKEPWFVAAKEKSLVLEGQPSA